MATIGIHRACVKGEAEMLTTGSAVVNVRERVFMGEGFVAGAQVTLFLSDADDCRALASALADAAILLDSQIEAL